MNIKTAIEILEIETTTNEINSKYLKKQYHKLALQFHPDKNNHSQECCEKFKKINEAYHFLYNELNIIENDESETNNVFESFNKSREESEETKTDGEKTSTIYMELLRMFMKGIFEGKYNEIIFKIIQEIVLGCKKITIKLFEDLDKDTCLKIYSFISKYRNILHLNEAILVSVREIVQQKFTNVLVYKLNPSISDLINNNIFKLSVNDQICFVPLWIKETYFDISGNEVIVLCEPELPEHIKIDDDNNLYIDKIISSKEELYELIQNNADIQINIDEKVFEIPIRELKMKKEQRYVIKNQGLLIVDDLDFENYFTEDNSENKEKLLEKKAHIIVNIIIS
jgi:hypothetical protein